MLDKQRGIRASNAEAQCLKEPGDTLVPGARCLLEPVERPGQQTHIPRKRCVDETGRLLTVNLLLKMAMEESVGDIHLMNWPASGHCKLENGADRVRFDNRCKRLSEVKSSALSKTTNHPTSLVALKCTI